MKFVFLSGGFVGFTLAALAGLGAGRQPAYVLRDAAFGCLAGAFLFRWFWSVLVRALTETLERRRREAEEKAKADEAKPTAAPASAPGLRSPAAAPARNGAASATLPAPARSR